MQFSLCFTRKWLKCCQGYFKLAALNNSSCLDLMPYFNTFGSGLHPQVYLKRTFINSLVTTGQYSISQTYSRILLLYIKPGPNFPHSRWRKDFPMEELELNLLEGYNTISRLLTSNCWRETQFKILHRVYVTYFLPNTPGVTTKPVPICPKTKRSHNVCGYALKFNYFGELYRTAWNILRTETSHYTHGYTYLGLCLPSHSKPPQESFFPHMDSHFSAISKKMSSSKMGSIRNTNTDRPQNYLNNLIFLRKIGSRTKTWQQSKILFHKMAKVSWENVWPTG